MRSAILQKIKAKRMSIQQLEAEIKELYDQLENEQEQPPKRLKKTVDQKSIEEATKKSKIAAESSIIKRKISPDMENIVFDRYSNLRIYNAEANLDKMDRLMVGRKFIHISNIALQACKDDDIRGNWITSGIVFAPPKSRDAGSFSCINLTDMSNTVRIFLFGDAKAHFSQLANGKIISILNPDILKPVEVVLLIQKRAPIGLSIENPKKILVLGDSVDIDFCPSLPTEKKCMRPIDSRLGTHCMNHSAMKLTKSKVQRQEFAANTSLFYIGDPEKKDKKKLDDFPLNFQATYYRGKSIIQACGTQVKLKSPPKPTAHREKSKSELEMLERMIHSSAAGAKAIRAMNGITEQDTAKAIPNVFGPEAIRRMGGNPFNDTVYPIKPELSKDCVEREESSDFEIDIIESI